MNAVTAGSSEGGDRSIKNASFISFSRAATGNGMKGQFMVEKRECKESSLCNV